MTTRRLLARAARIRSRDVPENELSEKSIKILTGVIVSENSFEEFFCEHMIKGNRVINYRTGVLKYKNLGEFTFYLN